MDIQTLFEHCETDDERRTILTVLWRANSFPCIVVTVKEGKGSCRYVVVQEDEHLFEGVANGTYANRSMQSFGAQWLRGMGRVDEMYRSLSFSDITKVERIDRNRVWLGEGS